MQTWITIAIGGACGAVSRYGVGLACQQVLGDRFGYGTLLVNVVGCFLLGLLMHFGVALPEKWPHLAHPGITVGLLGGLTTFSTFGFQTIQHFESGEVRLGLINIAANVLLGCLAAALGLWAARALA